MKKFNLVSEYKGYVNKKDITNLDPRFLVAPSVNTLINDGERVGVRPGYTLDGDASASNTPIISAYDWITNTGAERNIRGYAGALQYRYVDSSGVVTWRDLKTGLGTQSINFAEWWMSAQVKDVLLFVDGTSNLYMWGGGIATISSSTVNTITKSGANSWAQDRFFSTGTRELIINGVTYTYTGGETTTTLSGVSPSPIAEALGSIVIQNVITTVNTPGVTFNNDIIAVSRNQVYIADTQRRDVFISRNSSYTDFTFGSPRLSGQGAVLTLDSAPQAFSIQEDVVYVSGAQNDWYQTKFTLASDLSREELTIVKLKTGPGQGALGQSAVAKTKNSIIYISNELSITTLGRIENLETPQSLPISDPIKSEIKLYSITTTPDIKYFQNNTYFTFPSSGMVLIFDHERGFWQPPQILPISKWSIINNELYGHSASTAETYKVFVSGVYNDNGNPTRAIAAFAYRSYGRRDWQKCHDEWLTEGYISPNTVLTLGLNYDYGGHTTVVSKDIDGSNLNFLYTPIFDASLGKNPLGSQPIGSYVDTAISSLPKFRIVHEIGNIADYYEIQSFYETNDLDYQWEIVAGGGNIRLSTSDNTDIKA